MDKLKRKQSMFSVLKTVAYFVGFPLMMVVVLIGSSQFMHYGLFENTWYVGLLIVAIPWFLASVMQIVFGCFVKSQNLKTIAVVLVVCVVMIGSALVIDFYGKNTIADAQKKYSEDKYVSQGVVVDDYNKQVNWYVTLSGDHKSLLDKFKSRLELFTSVYHIEHLGHCWSDSENIDGSPVTANSTEKGLGLTNCYTSPNGLLADGWIFSAQNAVDILITYNELDEKAKSNGIDLEADYKAIIEKVKASPEYIAYQSSEEYQKAYGENGTAYSHMITEDRLDEMMPVVSVYLSRAIYDIANIAGNISYGLINDYIPIDKMAQIKTLDELVTYVNAAIPNIAGLLDGFVGADANPLRPAGPTSVLTLEKQFVLDLLDEMTYYYSPTVRPVFDFIKEATNAGGELACEYKDVGGNVILTSEEVQRFAYARYYAKVHGANVGSILIGDNLGAVTMDSQGYPAESFAFTLAELYQMDADLSYIPELYPILVARRYLYVFTGIIALSIILFYQFVKKQDDIINERIITKGGSK